MTAHSTARPRALPAVLALAILGISVSGPLARLADAAPLAIAVWRLLLSLAIVGAVLLWTGSWREWRQLGARDYVIALGAGAFLALHFWSWIASLGMTSVAASVLLVNLHPVVIVAGSALWLGERPSRAQVLGIAIALVGAGLVALAPVATGGSARVLGTDHALRALTSSSTGPSGVAGPQLGPGTAGANGTADASGAGDAAGAADAGDASGAAGAADAGDASGAGDAVGAESQVGSGVPAPVGAVREEVRPRRAQGLPTTRTEASNEASTEASNEASNEASSAARTTRGNLLAIFGALTVGLYYLAGRSLRQRLSLWPYVGLVYGACCVVLLGLAAWQRTPLWPYAPRELGIFALIALGPMLAGHTGFNWALRYVPAYVVSLALLAEPVGAALLAALVPGIGEVPSPTVIAGGAVVLLGLGVASWRR